MEQFYNASMKIQGSVAIVTGASGGIGLAIARELGLRGAHVALVARSVEKLNEIEKEIKGSLAVVADLREPSDVTYMVDETIKKIGRVDILINNAGQGLRSSVEKLDIEDYKEVMELNVFSVVRAMQAVIPIMRKEGKGMILNISSMVSKNYYPELAGYSSTKYALNAITLTARAELEEDGIIVSAFHPKMTATEFGQNARGETYHSSGRRPGMGVDTAEDVAKKVIEQIESEEAEAAMAPLT